jgi:hypothetical protein
MSLQTGRVVSFETFRRERESRRARVLPYLAPTESASPCLAERLNGVPLCLPERLNGVPPRLPERGSPFRGVELTDREVEHRQRMLRYLSDGGVGTPEEVPYG